MSVGGLVSLQIDDLSSAGEGVGRDSDGRAVFVAKTVPGESVTARITREQRTWARGELVEVVDPSDERREPRCPLFERCGGCQLQHVTYARQLDWKQHRIREALARIGGLEVGDVPVAPADREFGYRNRVSFTLKRTRAGRVLAGFHERGRPHRLVDVRGECFLPEPGLLTVWIALRSAWGARADRLPPGAELRLTLRGTTEGVALVVDGGRVGNRDAEHAAALVDEIEELRAIWHRPDGAVAPLLLAGRRTLSDRWFGEGLEIESSAFLQVNRVGAAAVHEAVMKEIGPPVGLGVVDAYAGVAAHGRRLAREGARVVAIELDRAAVRVAERDAPEGLSVECGRVEELLPGHLPADRVIVNPPRVGVDEAVTSMLVQRPVPRVIYVSCDPATLARDLSRLSPAYTIGRVRAFDLFPQTAHVESVVTLEALDPHA